MKKLFIVLTVAILGFVACNNESKTEVKTDTLTTAPTDPVIVDTTMKVDTTGKVDSLKK